MQITNYPVFLNINAGMSLTALVSAIFNFLLLIAGLAALVMIVFGGVKYLTSAGDPGKTKDAKDQVFAAILGLIILFSSWIILNSINPNLVNVKEPGAMPPPPEIEQLKTPQKPPAEIPAAFYYIPLGKIIDEVVAQEKDTLLKIRKFANLATRCGAAYCEGGQCDYWVSAECPAEEPTNEPPASPPPAETHWWDWLLYLKPPSAYALEECGSWETCSASCNTGDPCPADQNELIDKVLANADKTELEMAQLQRAREKIAGCVLDEEAVLITCQEAQDTFPQEAAVQGCRQAYDFYCAFGSDEDVSLYQITIPFATVKETIASIKELASAVSSCSCSNASFQCETCGNACGGSPCLAETYSALDDALVSSEELEKQLQKLEETVAEIAGLSAADEITTLTCSEAYSWLKSIKESGCPGVKNFPCCPVDQETEKTIRSCRFADFFFCSQP